MSDPEDLLIRAFSDSLVRLRAQNASPMTYSGTNTYILGRDSVTVIDPGPDDSSHLTEILDIISGRPVTQILVTHSHRDHSALALRLSHETGAPVLAFGTSDAGRSDIMRRLAPQLNAEGGEGVDVSFHPDQILSDGASITVDGSELLAIHTPGHMGNHMCFLWNGTLFSGDHIMGWASSLISPPDGDLNDFLASCRKLLTLPLDLILPGHGAPILSPEMRVNQLITHRDTRTKALLEALKDGPATPRALTEKLYTDIPSALLPAAERNVLAHLIALYAEARLTTNGPVNATAIFSLQDQ